VNNLIYCFKTIVLIEKSIKFAIGIQIRAQFYTFF
jgi:hypothetical protein